MKKAGAKLRNITLSAEAGQIERAREVAAAQHRTLNDAFREWLNTFVSSGSEGVDYRELLKSFAHVSAGRSFSRDEMNER